MTEEKTYTLTQAQLYFATTFNGRTWELLDKKDRTQDEDRMMVEYAYASMTHWRAAGTAVRHKRGEWMISRVHAVLGEGKPALEHARRCLEITEGNQEEMEDFDYAYAYEAVARAFAVNGDRIEAKKFIDRAQTAGEAIKGKEDRETFFSEFNGGNWNGIK